jgi:hypothetical protein
VPGNRGRGPRLYKTGRRSPRVGCIAGALSVSEYRQSLTDVEIVFTQHAADGTHSAIMRAGKPSTWGSLARGDRRDQQSTDGVVTLASGVVCGRPPAAGSFR